MLRGWACAGPEDPNTFMLLRVSLRVSQDTSMPLVVPAMMRWVPGLQRRLAGLLHPQNANHALGRVVIEASGERRVHKVAAQALSALLTPSGSGFRVDFGAALTA